MSLVAAKPLECGGLTPPLQRKGGVKPPHSKASFGRGLIVK